MPLAKIRILKHIGAVYIDSSKTGAMVSFAARLPRLQQLTGSFRSDLQRYEQRSGKKHTIDGFLILPGKPIPYQTYDAV